MGNGFDPSTAAAKQPKQDKPVKHKAKASKPKNVSEVTLTVPVDQCFPGYATPSVDSRLTPRQAATLKVLWSSLSERGQRYQGGPGMHPRGTSVENGPAAVRWILDQVGDAIEAETGKMLLVDYELKFG